MQWANECFMSIKHSSIPLDVYVVDNGSKDETINYIKKNYPDFILYESRKNLGFGRANNIGLQYAIDKGYDYVYLLNQDAWLMPDTIGKLIDINKKYPQYGILSPFQVQKNMKKVEKCFNMYHCTYSVNPDLFDDIYFGNIKDVYEGGTPAAHWLISRDCLLKVGGFSPSFGHNGEDMNYVDRTNYHGFKCGMVPNVVAVHDSKSGNRTHKQLLQVCKMSQISIVSSLCMNHRLLRLVLFTLKNIIKLRSIMPVASCIRIMLNYIYYFGNRNMSKDNCAFLCDSNLIKKQ